MAKKKLTLPKNFNELIEAGDLSVLKEVFEKCDYDARGGYSKGTALSFYKIPDELVRWLVEQGADRNAQDNYKRTPLHSQATSWCGNPRLLLELGADKEALDYQNETPLHAAAGSFKAKAVQALLDHGANIHAANKMNMTPLAKALAVCRNADITEVARIARILLEAGTQITPEMKESVKRIGTDFEFHKDKFNKDSVEETAEALLELYKQFDVAPVPKRVVHDGTSLITVAAAGWPVQHEELWKLLVPGSGHAATVQGEVIRITGRISHEILGNGGGNWDREYRKMTDALIGHLGTGTALTAAELQEAAAIAKSLPHNTDDEGPARLCELAVQWVIANPGPVPLNKPNYKR
jgi:hypothetical protein